MKEVDLNPLDICISKKYQNIRKTNRDFTQITINNIGKNNIKSLNGGELKYLKYYDGILDISIFRR